MRTIILLTAKEFIDQWSAENQKEGKIFCEIEMKVNEIFLEKFGNNEEKEELDWIWEWESIDWNLNHIE